MNSPKPVPPPDKPIDPALRATRRTFASEYRNEVVDAYRGARFGEKSAVPRREGLYQSQPREWSATREDATPEDTVRRRKAKGSNSTDVTDRK